MSYCTQVTLLDTRTLDSLDWVTYTSSNSSSRGWRESSYNDNDNLIRVYYACDIVASALHNWLRTPYINVGEANRLYIEMGFTMRKCTNFPSPEQLQQCKESYKLLYYGADSDIANSARPTWDTAAWTHIDVIAADKTYEGKDDVFINQETRDIEVTHNGLYFAFYDTGACTSLIYVRIYYITCPEYTIRFSTFPETQTGADTSKVVQQSGVCVANAAMEDQPKALCSSSGDWQLPQGGCKCMPGYEPDGETKCIPCPVGKYKWRTGSERCRDCPARSEAKYDGSVECQCTEGYYRNVNDDKSEPCTSIPSQVQNLRNVFINQTSIRLEWDQPLDLGGRPDLTYRVEVFGNNGTLGFIPSQKSLKDKYVIIYGFAPETKYKVIIYSENGVSSQSPTKSSEEIYITTGAALPPKVMNVRFTTIGSRVISLAWDAPVLNVQKYEVRHYTENAVDNATVQYTTFNNYSISGLMSSTKYYFQVRAQTSKGWGEYSTSMYALTSNQETDTDGQGGVKKVANGDNNVGIIVGAAISVIVCMLIVFIMVFFFIKRNGGRCNEKGITDCENSTYGNVPCHHLVEGSPALNNHLHMTSPLFTPPGGVKTYIDPHTYEDPNQAVREFTKEIDASFITIESVIGGGEFGDVCKGRLRINQGRDIPVAIKTLKAGASDKNRLDFLTEASIMGQFDDPNVIYLEGVVTKTNPNMIVMEFMENGALDAFLRNNDGKFTVLQLVGMMRGVASGMRYLSEMSYIHRDLAARNILVNERLVCKVADFGLSREIESDDTSGAYTTKGGKIPVRWTAPEAIAYRKFTSAADVWSYGVVMWEVMSYGERPYWNWSNQDVIKAVDKGFRLPPPMDCPEMLYQLMVDCWQKERGNRPKFSAIVKSLDKLIRSPEMLRNLAKQRPHEFINPNKADFTSYQTVESWLVSIKMERYLELFIHAGIQSIDRIALLSLQDLESLGITLVGHQKKIMNSVQTLRAHLNLVPVTSANIITMENAQVSNGFVV